MKFKACTKCGEVKSFDDFHKDKNYKDNRTGWCKECTREQHREHYKQNKSEVLKKQKVYYENNKQKILKRMGAYQKKHLREFWVTGTLHSHKHSGKKICISRKELLSFVYDSKTCEICGCNLNWTSKGKKGRLVNNSPTLDRINNEDFLAPHNVQIVCHSCNTRKHIGTMKEFVDYCKMIADKFGEVTKSAPEATSVGCY